LSIASIDALQGTPCTISPGTTGLLQISYSGQTATFSCGALCGTAAAMCVSATVAPIQCSGGLELSPCALTCSSFLPASCEPLASDAGTALSFTTLSGTDTSTTSVNVAVRLTVSSLNFPNVNFRLSHTLDDTLPPQIKVGSANSVNFVVNAPGDDVIFLEAAGQIVASATLHVTN